MSNKITKRTHRWLINFPKRYPLCTRLRGPRTGPTLPDAAIKERASIGKQLPFCRKPPIVIGLHCKYRLLTQVIGINPQGYKYPRGVLTHFKAVAALQQQSSSVCCQILTSDARNSERVSHQCPALINNVHI